MKKINTLILRTAGTNCDRETAFAFKNAGSEVDLVHINRLKKKKDPLEKYHILAIPGGFTYGDDIASGKILANELKFNLKEQLKKFIKQGKLIIGICNGFQVLVKMGLLPGIKNTPSYQMESTLSLNDSGKFIAKWVYLKNNPQNSCVWTKGLPDVIDVPIAHAEGKFIPKNPTILKKLIKNKQIVFQYTDGSGQKTGFPYNPNGSTSDIAGICDPSGRILGMMPHPERHIDFLQNPNWRRADKAARKNMGIGLEIFKNGVGFAKRNL